MDISIQEIRERFSNVVKFCLIRFGNKDEEGFYFEDMRDRDGKPFSFHLQTGYDLMGRRYEQRCSMSDSNKLVARYTDIYEFTLEQMNDMIDYFYDMSPTNYRDGLREFQNKYLQ